MWRVAKESRPGVAYLSALPQLLWLVFRPSASCPAASSAAAFPDLVLGWLWRQPPG